MLRAVSNKLSGVLELLLDVKALHSDLASRRRDIPGQTLERGRFASAVDTEKREALTVV